MVDILTDEDLTEMVLVDSHLKFAQQQLAVSERAAAYVLGKLQQKYQLQPENGDEIQANGRILRGSIVRP